MGSGASGARTRNHFHISYGCRDNYINRCAKAIRACMRRTYYSWPDGQERKSIADEMQKRYNLPNCVVLVDGTTFRLASKPEREDAADYSGRHEGYTITNLFFSDYNKKIRYYVTGWAGCAHDNRMWTNCQLYKNLSAFFSPNEYALGDSAFDNGQTYGHNVEGAYWWCGRRFNEEFQ